MTVGGGAFSPEEVKYLKSLPAVAEATSRRITYTDDFKRYCVTRYNEGASPVRLFREAGLDSALIGYKRIERCLARWREAQDEILGAEAPEPAEKNSLGGGVSHSKFYRSGTAGTSDTANEWRETEGAAIAAKAGSESDFHVSPERRAVIFPISRKEQNNDLRDLLIAQQVRRIDELERQVDMLEALLHSGRRGSRASSSSLPKRESGERGSSSGNNDVAPTDSDRENRNEDHGEGHGE